MKAQPLLAAALLLGLAQPASAASVRLDTADGVTLRGEDFGSGPRGVVLVHGHTRSAEDWSYLAGKLAEGGFHTLIFDLRGHGNSVPPDRLPSEAAPTLIADVDAAIAWMKAHGATEITLVGAELGANLALNAASDDPDVDNLVLVSPGMNLDGVFVKQPLIDYGARPILIVASNEDAYAAKTGRFLSSLSNGPKQLSITATGSGARMINRDVDLESLVISWIGGSWREEAAAAEARDLEAGSIDEIETSGIKFGED